VLERRSDDRRGIDPAVLVEVLVLDRDGRLLEEVRDLLAVDRVADGVGLDVAEPRAVGRIDDRVGALVDRLQLVDVDLAGDAVDPRRSPAHGDQDQADQDCESDEELAADRASRPAMPSTRPLRHEVD
jgi:hypothetical protein